MSATDASGRPPLLQVEGLVTVFPTRNGLLRVRERCMLLESAVIFGQVVTPWLDVRIGARIRGEVLVEREKAAGGST